MGVVLARAELAKLSSLTVHVFTAGHIKAYSKVVETLNCGMN